MGISLKCTIFNFYGIWIFFLYIICFPLIDSQDMTKDTQKKSKRKGRNKQEVITVSQTEPEPEAVKTPIDLMRVSTPWPKHLFRYHLLYEGHFYSFSTITQCMKFICRWLILFLLLNFWPHLFLSSHLVFLSSFTAFFRPKKTVALPQQRRKISLSISIIKRDRTD